jgi:hypothetical protein
MSFVGAMTVPPKTVEYDHRPRRSARRHEALSHKKTGCAVVPPEFVNHENETGQSPIFRNVLVKTLSGRSLPQRPANHAAQLERLADDSLAGIQKRRMSVYTVELGTSIDEVMDSRGSASLPYILGLGFDHRPVIGMG